MKHIRTINAQAKEGVDFDSLPFALLPFTRRTLYRPDPFTSQSPTIRSGGRTVRRVGTVGYLELKASRHRRRGRSTSHHIRPGTVDIHRFPCGVNTPPVAWRGEHTTGDVAESGSR